MTNQQWREKLCKASAELAEVANAMKDGREPRDYEGKVTHVSCVLDTLIGDVEGALSLPYRARAMEVCDD